MTTKPTILVSINTAWNIYHFRRDLMEACKAQGYRIATAAPDDAYSKRLSDMVDAHYSLPMDNAGTSPLADVMLFFRYIRLLCKLRPAVMLTYTIKPNIYGSLAAKVLGVPVIANVSGLGTAFIRNDWLTWFVKPLYWMALRSTKCVFFQNPVDLDLFLAMRLVASKQSALLPGSGVNVDYFHPMYNEASAPQAPTRFVLIARLLWDKGIGEYIDAARIVKAKYPNSVFHLVGPGDVKNKTAITSEVIAGWATEGIVEYLGNTDDVRSVIARYDCVVLPSYREGMSRVLLEAAAMGKPLIATDVPGCSHVVEHEKNGLLCRVRDAQHLAEQIMRLIDYTPQQRTQMGAASRAKAEREFDQRLVFDAYLKKINAIISV